MDVVGTMFKVDDEQYEQIDKDNACRVRNDIVEDVVGGDEDAIVAKAMGGEAAA